MKAFGLSLVVFVSNKLVQGSASAVPCKEPRVHNEVIPVAWVRIEIPQLSGKETIQLVSQRISSLQLDPTCHGEECSAVRDPFSFQLPAQSGRPCPQGAHGSRKPPNVYR